MISNNDSNVNFKYVLFSLIEKSEKNLTRALLLKIAVMLNKETAASIGRDLNISRQYVNNFIKGFPRFYHKDIASIFTGWGLPKEIVWPFETPKKKAA